jgi:heterodisulfide reductase subunit A
MGKNEVATLKAIDIVKMHVAKIRKLEPLKTSTVPVTPGVLVIGAGIAGLTAALSLADQGFQVHIIEKEPACGGLLQDVKGILGTPDMQSLLQEKILKVKEHRGITLHTSTEVQSTRGFVGNFSTTLDNGRTFDHGAIIIATGGLRYSPEEYGYPQSDRILTQSELEQKLLASPLKPDQHIAMIQCVGSREAPYNFCSRICCQEAIKNAITIKKTCPQTHVTIFYRDIRTYGLWEFYYQQARELGVLFVRYDVDHKPQVSISDQGLDIACHDPILNRPIRLEANYLVLSTGMRPHPSSTSLAEAFKLTRNEDGLRPMSSFDQLMSPLRAFSSPDWPMGQRLWMRLSVRP